VIRRRTATGSDVTAQIADEMYTALERLGAGEELLDVVGSWRDALSDAEALQALITFEVCAALKRLGADEELRAIVGSWRDTLDDSDVLRMLREYNAGRPTLHRAQ
jgi:hypothetical protein